MAKTLDITNNTTLPGAQRAGIPSNAETKMTHQIPNQAPAAPPAGAPPVLPPQSLPEPERQPSAPGVTAGLMVKRTRPNLCAFEVAQILIELSSGQAQKIHGWIAQPQRLFVPQRLRITAPGGAFYVRVLISPRTLEGEPIANRGRVPFTSPALVPVLAFPWDCPPDDQVEVSFPACRMGDVVELAFFDARKVPMDVGNEPAIGIVEGQEIETINP